jgi:AcrR family transcriptional regulator
MALKSKAAKSRRNIRRDDTTSAPSSKQKVVRKLGSDDSETRTLILDAAEQLMQEEGYAAVTSRRLGAKAGINAQLIHYYFRSMDNLFLELWRRYTEANIAQQAQAFLSPQPLRTLWESAIDQGNTTLGAEIMALARHRKDLRAEISRTAEAFRRLQAGALAKVMSDYGLKDNFGSAEILSVLIAAVARILVVENELDISLGHADTRALIEGWIDRLEGERIAGKSGQSSG